MCPLIAALPRPLSVLKQVACNGDDFNDEVVLQPSRDRYRYQIAQQKPAVQDTAGFLRAKSPAAGAAGPKERDVWAFRA